ncbi:hypothetical protein [Streptomyces sp. NBC_01481]|uniref:hypothetical protein n=1 Tax=Streptomyces sp. NBC_01481 TaxID=2975869 RepID=UPI002257D332|nr:hypothetical protein [Streptomyces sp. NBC_01481]MCX4582135.1 hypothetical protein [Streptomyces sp. NBC_01481]
MAQLRAGIRSTEQIRRRGELTKITALLPVLLADARAAVRQYTGDDRAGACAVLAEAYQVAATTLTAFGKEDAAYTAIERSMTAARQSDDPRLEMIGVSSLSWIFSKQGRLADAEQVAVRMAERIEPGFRSAPIAEQIALSGCAITPRPGTSWPSCGNENCAGLPSSGIWPFASNSKAERQ